MPPLSESEVRSTPLCRGNDARVRVSRSCERRPISARAWFSSVSMRPLGRCHLAPCTQLPLVLLRLQQHGGHFSKGPSPRRSYSRREESRPSLSIHRSVALPAPTRAV